MDKSQGNSGSHVNVKLNRINQKIRSHEDELRKHVEEAKKEVARKDAAAGVPTDLDSLSFVPSDQKGSVQPLSAGPSALSSGVVAPATFVPPDEMSVAEGLSIGDPQVNVSPSQLLPSGDGETGVDEGVVEEDSSMQVESPVLVEEEKSSN